MTTRLVDKKVEVHMINDYEVKKIANYRHLELLEEARMARLLKRANTGKNAYLARLLSKIGDLLIALGRYLKGHHEQEVELQHSL